MTIDGGNSESITDLNRRTVLKGMVTASAVGIGSAAASGGALAGETDESAFAVEQDGDCYEITALSTGETVEAFYGYAADGEPHSHTSTGIEQSDVSNLFLFEGDKGRSLVVQHDEPNDDHGTDTGGGAVSFDVAGLDSGSWVVADDGNEPTDWSWAQRHTDGGAWRGGLDCDFEVTVDSAFNQDAEREPLDPGTIDAWHVLSGDADDPDRITLDMGRPVTISCRDCIAVDTVDFKGCSEVWIAFETFRGKAHDIQVNVDGTWHTVTVEDDDLTTIPGQFGHETAVFKYDVDDEKLLGVRVDGDEYTNEHRCAANSRNGGD